MTDQNKIKVLTRQADGFTATIHQAQPRKTICRICGAPKTAHYGDCPEENDPLLKKEVATLGQPPETKRTPHTCLAANCGTLIGTEDFFCEYHFQKLPPDLCWQYVKSADGPPRQMILQQMVDHFTHAAVANPDLFGALQAIEQLTRGTLSTHVHQIAVNAIKAAEAVQ